MTVPGGEDHGRSAPKAAIIIPAYNAARTLAETVESALHQTESRIEVVVVDDGSTDETARLGNELATRDGRVSLYSVTNGGPARARNVGLRVVSAPFVAFLDADDLVPPDKIELQVSALEEDPAAAAVYSDECYLELADGQSWTHREKSPLPADPTRALLSGEPFPMCIHSALHRRSWLSVVGGFREERLFWGTDDYDLLIRIALAGGSLKYTPGAPVLYRIHPGSISRDVLLINQGRLHILESLARELARRGSPDLPAVRMRVRHICLSLAGMSMTQGDASVARRFVLRAGLWSSRPGQLLEIARFMARPSGLLRFGKAEDPKGGA